MPIQSPVSLDILRGKTLLPTQARFLSSPALRKVYIGPVGSGKTEIICIQSILLSHYYLPNNALIGRQTYPELRDTTRKRFMEICPPELIDTRNTSIPESGGGGHVAWKAGGRTMFRHLDTMSDLEFGSLDLGYAAIDEITETPQRSFDMLEARAGRHWKAAHLTPEKFPYSPVFGGGNPAGHDWVWKRFFDETRDDVTKRMYQGFQPEPRENERNLPPGYYDTIALGKPDWWVRRYIRGELSALEGLVWPNFDEQLHVLPDLPVPKEWLRYTGHDHGRRNPTACLWVAVDYDGFILVYREYEVSGPTPPEHAAAILAREQRQGDKIAERYADPSMFSKTIPGSAGKWHAVADEYADCGLEMLPGNNAQQPTLDRVGALLWADPQRQFPDWHPRAGQKGSPRLFFAASCRKTIEAVSSWRYKEYRQGDLGLREEPVDFNDHLPDCLRYVCTAFPEAPARPRPKRDLTVGEWQSRRLRDNWRQVAKNATEQRREADY